MTVKTLQPAIIRFSLVVSGLFMILMLLSLFIGQTLRADRIIFLSNHAGSYKLYGMDIQRGLMHNVNNVEMRPNYAMSPDGQRIVYMQSGNGLAVIFTMKLNGTDSQQLVGHPGAFGAWSPDSQSIAYVTLNENQTSYQIYRMNDDGIPSQPLTDLPSYEYPNSINWSPDGTQILFQGLVDSRIIHLYLMKPDGSELHRINYPREFDSIHNSKWSPDSRHFAFIARFFNDDRTVLSTSLCLSEAELTQIKCFDNAGLGALQDSVLNAFDWSPDSTRIAFASGYGMSIATIAIFNLETSSTHRVLIYAFDPKKKSIGNLIWTPDGRQFIYEVIGQMGPNAGTQLYSVNIDGSGERNLTVDSFNNVLPTWWTGD